MQPPSYRYSDRQLVEVHQGKTRHYARLMAQHTCRLRPGVEAFIRAPIARGQTLAIATTTTFSNVEGLLSGALGRQWRSLFAAVVSGDEVARKKPAPDVYLEVLRRLGRLADGCLAIEDSANGLNAAVSAGIPVLITRSEYFPDDDFSPALAVVDDLTELAYPWRRDSQISCYGMSRPVADYRTLTAPFGGTGRRTAASHSITAHSAN
jgi:HAD superfamily hydrolase (TIGR01509 family)